MEPLTADNRDIVCFKVWVWHTKTILDIKQRNIDKTEVLYPDSNIKKLREYVDMIDPNKKVVVVMNSLL